jgi:formamidopyrimidine-DNA glycosylase
LDRGGFLYYNDLRQFGWIKIIETSKLKDLSFFRDMGPEPLPSSGQAPLTLQMFKKIISSSNTSVKPLIMDQKKIGGIGNIYANDGLFDSGIDPRRKAKSLSEDEIKKLYKSILKVLKLSLKIGGASELNFVNVLGEEGKYQDHSLIYGRVGQKCKRCGGVIKKIFLGGRGTYFCPACQK